MALVADLYGLSVSEAMNLTDKETAFLLEKAQNTLVSMAVTTSAMQEMVRGQLSPTIRAVRDARAQTGGTDKPVGTPRSVLSSAVQQSRSWPASRVRCGHRADKR